MQEPVNIPPGVQRELEAAAQRTGWTMALDRAWLVLVHMFQMTPEEFERYSAGIYDKTS